MRTLGLRELRAPSVTALAGDAPCHLPQRGRQNAETATSAKEANLGSERKLLKLVMGDLTASFYLLLPFSLAALYLLNLYCKKTFLRRFLQIQDNMKC